MFSDASMESQHRCKLMAGGRQNLLESAVDCRLRVAESVEDLAIDLFICTKG